MNSVWKGLGYYSRASRLFAGAQKVVKEYGGLLPDNAEEMQANIPGIGRYSAGAICSIAYGERVPVVREITYLSNYLDLHSIRGVGWECSSPSQPIVSVTRPSKIKGNP